MNRIYIGKKQPIKIGLIRASLIALVFFGLGYQLNHFIAPTQADVAVKQHCTPEQVSKIIQSRLQIALDGGYANVPYLEVKP